MLDCLHARCLTHLETFVNVADIHGFELKFLALLSGGVRSLHLLDLLCISRQRGIRVGRGALQKLLIEGGI